MSIKCDFSGWATKNNLKCSDGRTIMPNAFSDQDKTVVPLVWQHQHNDPENILGHAYLENRKDGVYVYGTFNDTPKGQHAKALVTNGDIRNLSIWANRLKQSAGNVLHGAIQEVSLVIAGANPGALIENVALAHSDGSYDTIDDEAVIYTDCDIELYHADNTDDSVEPTDIKKEKKEMADTNDKTVGEILEELTDDQKAAVMYLIEESVNEALENQDKDDDVEHSDIDGDDMGYNVFEQDETTNNGFNELMHDALADGKQFGTLQESVLAHADQYGFKDINLLFPDAKSVTDKPELISRQMDWVTEVLNSTTHVPFANIKSIFANITADEARAKGYVKGSKKVDEVIALLNRKTTPATIYKHQRLDRDDILDITEFDAVEFLKDEMELMLNEEVARAILVGDGRNASAPDKINDTNIRPITTDNDVYAVTATYDPADMENYVDAYVLARKDYRGSGNPVLFVPETILAKLRLIKDKMGRRIYSTPADLAVAIGCSKIIGVPDEIMKDIHGVMVNLADYKVGTNAGGKVTMFNGFDIDFNQEKYLIETRCSGALCKPYSAIMMKAKASGTPQAPGH